MVGIKVSEEKRREAILRAAYEVAARQGLEALTIRAVAARAHVSHGTVLFHFKRKHELVSGLLDRVMYATAVLRIPDTVAQITRPAERMHALLRAEEWTVSPPIRGTFGSFSIIGRLACETPRSGNAFEWRWRHTVVPSGVWPRW